ncbi:putrescine hydroxycinnamoyltransferase 3-like [Magnolia sinica]|uniref:putrescine hydroxycinnamoyltransferase 3-like n=1 Tax=Magnolia sinica TaxID=86752 RepID=UPI00265AF24E|nr:putrescine hydroxycinnamoyltransferase 3-like [Magnolia sinica]
MEIHVVSSTVIPQGLPPTENTKIPLTVFDMLASGMHIAVLHAYMPPMPTNTALKDGLKKALWLFPTLAGQLVENDDHCHPYISLGDNGGGVLVVETNAESELLDILPLEPSPELVRFHPPLDEARHLLQVQLNRFSCGGLVIGLTSHHRVADGKAISSFFIAWGKLVRGLRIDSFPVYDQTMLIPRDPPRCDHDHWGIEFQPLPLPPSSLPSTLNSNEIHNMRVHYSGEFILKIKARMPTKHSTFEVLTGHLWKNLTRARGLDPDMLTQIRVAVNGRPRLWPAAPTEYFGNMVLNAFPRARVKELTEGSVADAARLVHDAVGRIEDGYIRSLIDFRAINSGNVLVPVTDFEGPVLCPNLEVDSWLGFPFQEVDFGDGGSLCAFAPSWVPVEGVVILMPTLRGVGDGGVDVMLTLFQGHAELFSQISHSLD